VDLSDQRHARIDDRPHFFRHVFSFGLGEWNEAPIVFPSFVEDGGETLALTSEISKIDRSNFYRSFLRERVHQSSQSGDGSVFRIEPPCVPTDLFHETIRFNEAHVVRPL